MADDISIKGLNTDPSVGQNGSQQTGQNPAQSGATQGGGTQQTGTTSAASSDQLNPVIDLSGIDAQKTQQGGDASAGTAATQVTSSQTQAAQNPPAQQAPSKRRANALLLDEADATQSSVQDKYAIPSLVKEKFPDLIQLIKETESMNDEERDYWFQILPIMTEDQIKKFRDILVNEKQQLSHLDQEYEQELSKLNEKHLIEWKEFETREKRKTLTTAEKASKDQEKAEEEELLKRLSQV